MSDATISLGIIVLLVGLAVTTFEVLHPGAFLLIPGTVFIVVGLMYIFIPDVLTTSYYGPLVIAVVAIAAMFATIPLYKHAGKTHRPSTTTPYSLVGEPGLVVAAVDNDSLRGKVRVGSEIWSARASRQLPAGTRVRVTGGEGVAVTVEAVDSDASA
ncbi:MAG TPA: NfeD family protein [Thermoplasmata archaeon]|nr:NfeD family protein [Thermoplasmata archaeon]